MISANEFNIWAVVSIQHLQPLAVVGLFPRGCSWPGCEDGRLPVLVSIFGTRVALAVSRVQECTSQILLTRRSYTWHTALSTLLCVQRVIKESAVDLGSGLRCRQPTVPYLWPVTYVFRSKLQLVEVQLVCACEIIQFFLYCSVWLELCINLTLGLLQTKHLTNGDQWEEYHAVLESYVFDRICVFSHDRRR